MHQIRIYQKEWMQRARRTSLMWHKLQHGCKSEENGSELRFWIWSQFGMNTAFKSNFLLNHSVSVRSPRKQYSWTVSGNRLVLSEVIFTGRFTRGKRVWIFNCCAWSVKITGMAEWDGIKIQTRSGNYYIVPSPSVEPIRMRLNMIGVLNKTMSQAWTQGFICITNISPSTGVWYTW